MIQLKSFHNDTILCVYAQLVPVFATSGTVDCQAPVQWTSQARLLK